MDVVADFRAPRAGAAGDRPDRGPGDPDRDRQRHRRRRDLLAPGDRLRRAPGDVLLALSTSGNSSNVIEALAEARRRRAGARSRWSATTAAGSPPSGLADHVVVTRSEHIPRIQEAQASAYHVLRELVGLSVAPGGCAWPRAARGCACRAPSRASGSAPTCTGWPASWASPASCSTTPMGCCSRSRATRRRSSGSWRGWPAEAPPLAVVERVVVAERASPSGDAAFEIRASAARRGAPTRRSRPDSATCADCLRELFDPADRRYRYPFINCTELRPAVHDRPRGPLRPAADDDGRLSRCAPTCRAEYEDPADRRFHAQPNACPRAGRRCRCVGAADAPLAAGDDAVAAAAARCAPARSSRSRASAAFTWPAAPTTSAAVARAAGAQAPRGQAVRADGAVARRRPSRWWRSASAERALLRAPAAPDRARARRRDGAPVAASVAPGRARARRDAPLHAASPPAARRRRRARW